MDEKIILVIGSGGREHALVRSLNHEPGAVVYCSPGNYGTNLDGFNLDYINGTKPENFQQLYKWVKDNSVDMVVVGPEDPLCNGIVDFFNERGYNRIFGPTKDAARLESDKFFSYSVNEAVGIPQARSILCESTEQAIDAIKNFQLISGASVEKGIVVKARGLTAGKGVSVYDSIEEALEDVKRHAGAFGPEVLVAERLVGQEFSVFGISDGWNVKPFEMAVQDHKRRDDGDKGPNTGGMGAYCPAPIADSGIVKKINDEIFVPLVRYMKNERGIEYKGFIYGGMIMTKEGPKVIEYNIRFGDPEAQPAMMMLKNGLYQPLNLALDGRLDEIDLEFNKGASVCVVLASDGYPEKYDKGFEIKGLDAVKEMDNVIVFHAGTKIRGGDKSYSGTEFYKTPLTSGGRVLGVTAYGEGASVFDSIRKAQELAYSAVDKIGLVGSKFHYRTDIGRKAFELEKN
ncbi:MAG: phosphoribosylamine--glycine ligase [archaeon]